MNGFIHRQWSRAQPLIQQYFWIFAGYFLSQIGIQLLNFFTGFAIIRHLTKEEYAIYTIVNTLGPVMLVLSDNGIGSGMMALGRQFWQDDDKMGSLVTTAMRIRRKFAGYSLLVVAPLLIWLLHRNHAPVLTVAFLVAAVVVGISFQLTTAILRIVLELRQHVKTLGKVSLAGAALRFVLVVGCIVFYRLDALLATIAAACTFTLEASYLIHAVRPQIKWDAAPNPAYGRDLLVLMKKTLPLSIYLSVQSQVSVWLIGVFGNAHQVADIGAALRLGVIFTTLTSAFCIMMLPRFARTNGKRQLHRQIYEILGVLIVVLAGLVAFAALFPQPFVFLLGEKYVNMSGLFWLVLLATGYTSIVGIIFSLSMSKGWVPPAYLAIPVEIVSQIVLLLVLDLSKTADVLVFSLLSGLAPGILLFVLLLRNIAREPEIAEPLAP